MPFSYFYRAQLKKLTQIKISKWYFFSVGTILFNNFEISENILKISLMKIYQKILNSQKVWPQEGELAFFIFLSGSAQKVDPDKNLKVIFFSNGTIFFDHFEIAENNLKISLMKIYQKFLNSQKVCPQERELAFFIFLSGSAQKVDSDKNLKVIFFCCWTHYFWWFWNWQKYFEKFLKENLSKISKFDLLHSQLCFLWINLLFKDQSEVIIKLQPRIRYGS